MNRQSLSRRRTKEIRSLSRKKYRKQLGQFIVEGRRAVAAAVEAGAPLVDVVVSPEARQDARIEELLKKISAPVYTCSEHTFEDLSDVQTSQGVLAVVQTRFYSADELGACTTILAFDGVQDPGNAGTLLRTAAWFGVEAVAAGAGTVDLVNPKVVRAAMGAHWELRLAAPRQLDEMIRRYRGDGFTIYAADLEGTPVDRWKPSAPSILVMGSEAHGLSGAVQEQVDERIYVGRPSRQAHGPGGVESLNVAVASGIILYHWLQ